MRKALKSNGRLSNATVKYVCLSAFTMTVAHLGLQLIVFCVMTDESPFLTNGTQVCFYGVVKQKRVIGVLYHAAPILISCGLFLSLDVMSLQLLRQNATDNQEIQRRRYRIIADQHLKSWFWFQSGIRNDTLDCNQSFWWINHRFHSAYRSHCFLQRWRGRVHVVGVHSGPSSCNSERTHDGLFGLQEA